MNERIRLLVEKAGISTTDHGRGPFIDDYVSLGDLERFAQLIVGECADLFEVEYGKSEISGYQVATVLKEHFGVKE